MKTKLMKSLILSTAVIAALTACERKVTQEKIVTKSAFDDMSPTAQTVQVSSNSAADELVDAGEQLVGPYTFPLADRAFAMALEKDSNNKKAQFYRAFLKPLMRSRGILDRLRPYARSWGNIAALDNMIKSLPESPLAKFLVDSKGQAPIKDAQDIQEYMAGMRDDWNDLRIFLGRNSTVAFDVYLNPHIFSKEINQNVQDNCVVRENSDGFAVTCETKDIAKIKVNAADLLALRQSAAGYVVLLSLYTSYSVKGLDDLFKDLSAASVERCSQSETHWDEATRSFVTTAGQCVRPNRQLGQKEIYERVARVPTAGLLTKNQGLKFIKGIGTDFSAAVKWTMKYQRELCPNGVDGKNNRKGFLFSKGFCIENSEETNKSLALFDAYLAGLVRDVTVETISGVEVKTDVDALALFERPVQDLRSLGVTSWKGDCATGLKDKTFGGLYPRGDAETIFLGRCE